MNRITFNVLGIPAPQGSKRPLGMSKTGRVLMIESSAKVKPWRMAVSAAAADLDLPLIAGPVAISLDFRFLRPRGHYTTKGALRASAPLTMAKRPDLDKLVRSTFDGLQNALLREDSQVVQLNAAKRFCYSEEKPGALISVVTL